MSEPIVQLICMPRVPGEDLSEHVPGTTIRWCSTCGDEIYVAPSGLKAIDDGAVPTCWGCATGIAAADGNAAIGVTAMTTAELRDAGFTDADLRAVKRYTDARFRADVKAKRRK